MGSFRPIGRNELMTRGIQIFVTYLVQVYYHVTFLSFFFLTGDSGFFPFLPFPHRQRQNSKAERSVGSPQIRKAAREMSDMYGSEHTN